MDGFTFDLAGIEAALAEWRQLRAGLDEDARTALALVAMRGPGQEPASNRMANSVTYSGEIFMEHIAAMRTFADRYIEALTTARDNYLMNDETGRSSYQGGPQ